ncbi:hypothetical protein GCM10028819_49180 [Spirosoma humi]
MQNVEIIQEAVRFFSRLHDLAKINNRAIYNRGYITGYANQLQAIYLNRIGYTGPLSYSGQQFTDW